MIRCRSQNRSAIRPIWCRRLSGARCLPGLPGAVGRFLYHSVNWPVSILVARQAAGVHAGTGVRSAWPCREHRPSGLYRWPDRCRHDCIPIGAAMAHAGHQIHRCHGNPCTVPERCVRLLCDRRRWRIVLYRRLASRLLPSVQLNPRPGRVSVQSSAHETSGMPPFAFRRYSCARHESAFQIFVFDSDVKPAVDFQ